MTNEYVGVYPEPAPLAAPPAFGLRDSGGKVLGTIVLSPYGLLYLRPSQKEGTLLAWRDVIELIQKWGVPTTQAAAEDRPSPVPFTKFEPSNNPMKFLGEDD